ncbi:MAG: DUF2950 domain-containing protein [Planctomycetota bacterium]|nr:DUF2950 domain-containing protein [Planctomycetota bacterium]
MADGIRILTSSIYKTGRSSGGGHHDREGPATSGASIAALILALVSLFFFPPFVGVAAFACAIIGLVTSRKKALPIIALLLSIVCPIIGFFMGVIVAIFTQASPNALGSVSESNEASAIASCRIFAEAEDIYFRTDWDGDGVHEYSQFIAGANSLYETREGAGDLTLVDAAMAGAEVRAGKPARMPKAGYYFKVLWKQGPGAPGGNQNYIKRGNMVEGYAIVAWPAQYGMTGQNTFILSKTGTVYARDLGQDTQSQCERMDTFDPTGWQPVE